MRQRKIKNLDEKLAHYERITVNNGEEQKGNWNKLFTADQPLYLEIGCGKGRFLAGCASKWTNRNFIGVEGNLSVVLRAFEKVEEGGIQNVRFVTDYVHDIRDLFDPGELSGIFLNFSDPWPKERHAKRRLTHGDRLLQYMEVIESGGFIQFKTDNDCLFAFTLEEIKRVGLTIEEVSKDLHHSNYAADNIMTEYEDKFSSVGKNINYVKIRA